METEKKVRIRLAPSQRFTGVRPRRWRRGTELMCLNCEPFAVEKLGGIVPTEQAER